MKVNFKKGDEVVDGLGHVFVVNRITKRDGVFLSSLEGDFQVLMCLSSFNKDFVKRKSMKTLPVV